MEAIYGQPRPGVGVLVRDGSRVLLMLRQGSHGAGEWSLPGGRVDPGETQEQTAARELAEETGLNACDIRFLPVAPTTDLFPDEGQHWVTSYFIWDWDGSEPRIVEPHKCAQLAWFEWDALPRPLFAGIDRIQAQFPDVRSI